MAKTNPFEFLQQVRAETNKVTWPSRKETMVTTVMVLIMVTFASIFFLIADQILSWGVTQILGS
ncbi:MAG: preprotein translocase subunit SecE [Rhizobiales bacterium]|nr:preprotein translocase subunit SecE [Alphaproteobacteria bacterium]NNF77622.1 preprotein translocase subunit SecE [Hyphomicrobiales bacterium]